MFYFIVLSLLYTSLAHIVSASSFYHLQVAPHSGEGICSPHPVVSFSYNITAPYPGFHHVVSCSEAAYHHLRPAHLSDPSSGDLPAPLLDMSCLESDPITQCNKQWPQGRRLKRMTMCILVMNESDETIHVEAQVQWNDEPQAAYRAHVPWNTIRSPLVMGGMVFGALCVVVFGCHWALARLEGSQRKDEKEALFTTIEPVCYMTYIDTPKGLYDSDNWSEDDDDDDDLEVRYRRVAHYNEP